MEETWRILNRPNGLPRFNLGSRGGEPDRERKLIQEGTKTKKRLLFMKNDNFFGI